MPDDPPITVAVDAVNTKEPELLVLDYAFTSFYNAELGFKIQLVKMFDAGYSVRQLAAACRLLPKDIKEMLVQYGSGVRNLANDRNPVKCPKSYQYALTITTIGDLILLDATVVCPECRQPVMIIPGEDEEFVFKEHYEKRKAKS